MMRLIFMLVLLAPMVAFGQGSIRRVGTVEELERLNPQASAVNGKLTVLLLGRDSVGDFGDPRVVEWLPTNSITADGACYFDVGTGVGTWWAPDCVGSVLDPRWFGAFVNDPVDDSIALQATIDAAGSGRSIRIPNGVYSITNTLYVTNNAVKIFGDGPDSSTIWMRSNGPALYVGFPGFDGGLNDYSRHQFILEDFGVRGVSGVTNQVGIQFSAASRIAMTRVFAETFGDEHEKGFFFERWAWWISVQNCKTFDCWVGLLASGNTTNLNIPENSFNAADFSGNTFRVGRYGIILGDPLYSPSTPLLPTAYAVGIRNNSIENFGELGVWVASPWNCIVDNNYIENNPIGVRIGATNWTSRVYDQAKNVAIKNNHIYTLTNSASAGLVLQDEKTCVQIQGGLFATIKENHFMGYKRAAVEIQSTGAKQTSVDGNGYYNYAEVPRVIGPFAGVAGNSFYHRWLGESWVGSGTNGPDELINNIVIDGSTNLFRAQVVLTNKPLQFAHGASDWKLSKFLDENRGLFHGGFSVSNGGINLLSTNGAGYALAYKRDYDPVQRTVIPQDGTLRFSDGTFDPDVGIGYAGAAGWIRLWTNIQGYGHVSAGPNPSTWGGYTKYGDRGIYHTSYDIAARPEVLIGYQDGTTNQRAGIAVSNRIAFVSALASLVGSEIRFMVDDQHATTVTNSGVVIPIGKSINLGGVARSSWPTNADLLNGFDGSYYLNRANHTGYQSYTTITGLGDFAIENYPTMDGNTYGINNGIWTVVSSGSSYSFLDGVTNSGGTITANLEPGDNISFATNSTRIRINAITSSSTNGTPVSVDGGAVLSDANFADTSEINHTATGTNITSALIDGSVSTNRIDSTFHGWISGKQDALTFSTGVTNAGGTITAALAKGANIEFVTNANTIEISAVVPTGTNTWQIGVDSVAVTTPNLNDSSELGVTATGTNVTYALNAGSITTNKIAASFHQWISSIGGSLFSVDGSRMSEANMKDGAEIAFSSSGTNVTASIVAGSIATNRASATFRQWVDDKILYVHGTEVTDPNLTDTGTVEVTATGSSIELDVPDGAITYTKLQNVSSTNRVLGLGSTAPGDAVELVVGDGLITSSTDLKLNIEAGSGIELATNGNKRVTITSKGYTPVNDAVANLLLVTTSETTDNNQDATWRDVTPSARSGMSATIPGGTLLSGSVMKVELSGVMDAAAADWAPQLRMIFDGPTASDYTITFIMNEPGSTYPYETTTWKAEAFIVVASAGSPATVRQRSFSLWADGGMSGSGSLAGYGLMTSGQSSNSLDTAADNTFRLEYQAVNANMQSFSVTSVVIWML